MNAEANELSIEFFIKYVMPYLDYKFSLKIIGPKPSQKLIRYKSNRIQFTGYLHVDDIKKELSNSGIFVCPMITGAGVKNKLIQAAVVGLPIINTTMGVEGLDKEVQKLIFIADQPKEFIDKINFINRMSLPKLQSLISAQRKVVKKHYSMAKLIKDFESEFF